jgi:putative nucleotidyltransferase with HDIG domain
VAGHHNEGGGRRLTAAFSALEAFPALAESRDRVLRLVTGGQVGSDAVVAAVESDVALVMAVLRRANAVDGPRRGRVESVRAAVELLSPDAVHALAARSPTFTFFEPSAAGEAAPERVRLHAVATQRAAERLAAATGFGDRDRLMATALLHDVGKLVLAHAYPGYPRRVHDGARTPQERLDAERRELGVDHAVAGGVLARRWGLPDAVASVIERHHAGDATGEAATVGLADLLAHYAQGDAVGSRELLAGARRAGLGSAELGGVLFELPNPVARPAPPAAPCPLSAREREVLERLSEGKVYKQIGADLGLSPSTVRSHLHNIYGKLGAADRAQAVLIAARRGWLGSTRRLAP